MHNRKISGKKKINSLTRLLAIYKFLFKINCCECKTQRENDIEIDKTLFSFFFVTFNPFSFYGITVLLEKKMTGWEERNFLKTNKDKE